MEIHQLHNTTFMVDSDSMVFRYGKQFKKCLRADHMNITPNGYEATQEFRGKTFPFFVELDPNGMRKRFSLAIDEKLPKTDQELRCNPDLILERIKFGKHPTITVGEWIYYANIRIWQLELQMNPKTGYDWEPISLDDVSQYDYGFKFYIDARNGMLLDDWEIMDKKHAILVEIPIAAAMDPVGWARLNNEPDLKYIDQHPIRYNIEARYGPYYSHKLYPKPVARRAPTATNKRTKKQ
ncbi:hypothetical protein WJU16_02730 [Chitinophaga pollutisoli]|uniref:GLPGLI family protein n=1 Tax=Chitinophaga pollutisoli TaxID=3133966 RepID=A0ABZ2YQY8_9BACT